MFHNSVGEVANEGKHSVLFLFIFALFCIDQSVNEYCQICRQILATKKIRNQTRPQKTNCLSLTVYKLIASIFGWNVTQHNEQIVCTNSNHWFVSIIIQEEKKESGQI